MPMLFWLRWLGDAASAHTQFGMQGGPLFFTNLRCGSIIRIIKGHYITTKEMMP
jgi:hypothetical protein